MNVLNVLPEKVDIYFRPYWNSSIMSIDVTVLGVREPEAQGRIELSTQSIHQVI